MRLIYKNVTLSVLIIFLIAGCSDNRTVLERIKDSGKLRFVTVVDPTSYIPNSGENIGFEYDLARQFADHIGVDLKMIAASLSHQVISMVTQGKAHVGAAAIVSNYPIDSLQFSPAYNETKQQVIYRYGNWQPMSIDDIRVGDLNIEFNKQQIQLMKDLETKHPQFSWVEHTDKNINTLLGLVQGQAMVATVANETMVNVYRHIYPNIRAAFDITDLQSQVWAYKKYDDDSLSNAISEFFTDIRNNGELEKLLELHFGHFRSFDYVDIRTYLDRIKNRLPEFEMQFKKVAKKHHMDWKLLAAMSYQESHWSPTARSPTGVRGLMMLTLDTARQMNINNRLDAEQSINGGARYFKKVYKQIPERIEEPDRKWFALAAYNIGYAHLEDARILTQMQGGNPDIWVDVRERLPLLSQKKWYDKTRNGKARGKEPVIYVRNIRRYTDILRWVNYLENKPKQKAEWLRIFSIDSPVL